MTKTMMKMLGVAGLMLAAALARAELAEYVDESGVFAHEPEIDWLADGYGVFANPDPTTCADYPYVVLSYKGREKGRIR